MFKKILFIAFLSVSSIGFSQNNVEKKTIVGLSAAPNPFTNTTKISFTANTNTAVFFTVKNVLGKTVYKKTMKAIKGKNTIPFYKNNLASGMYIYSIRDNRKTTSKRFVIK
ncbi:T9SS type A sorting domain-containing protein [uncultured Polaribacter sp.]|uniref:T9SS type A sorting domain-containing protein n=1 Tax=uncultured Polaribacter sp. TaxID=174711 RepID=UPI002636EB00|nr:T9SS type A sorting domain-containing protein [uncultured Polaribacter sp.]